MLTTTLSNLATELQELFQKAIYKAFNHECSAVITQSTRDHFGDYQCNDALKLSKQVGLAPREVAQKIVENLDDVHGIIEKCEIAGPGFVNIYLNKAHLEKKLSAMALDERLGIPLPKVKQRIICEFSSPNVAKAMHVGHLRSTIIGDALARLMEFLGHDVIRLNHIGDWGTQFGMLITYLKRFCPHVIENAAIEDLEQLMSWYKESKRHFDESPSFKKESQEEVVRLQSGDPTTLKAWHHICEVSRRAFEEIYRRLDIKLQERGESYYNELLPTVIRDFEKAGLCVEDDGAKVVFLEGFQNKEGAPLPLIIQKRDGGYNYSTTDLAGFKQRAQEEKAGRIIVVTDAGQSLHFQMIYQAAVKVGYIDPERTRFDHVTFGVVLAPNGKKFKTREGETERLSDLLDTATSKAKEGLKARVAEGKPADEDDLNHRAEIIGIGSIKYADLSCNRIKDYTFSYDRMLRFEGNTASFILYAYVRIQSIKQRTGVDIEKLIQTPEIRLNHPTEIALGLHLCRFCEALAAMDQELLPNRLTDYLFSLAEKFHAFFRDCRVEGDPAMRPRLILIELAGKVIAKGLDLLGIQTVKHM